jgi:hypothetical protein
MNEKIKQLAEQCATPESFDIVKYTELVVRECAGLVENQGRFLRYTEMASKIKENFGIKK